jgi:hypothetical protein
VEANLARVRQRFKAERPGTSVVSAHGIRSGAGVSGRGGQQRAQ